MEPSGKLLAELERLFARSFCREAYQWLMSLGVGTTTRLKSEAIADADIVHAFVDIREAGIGDMVEDNGEAVMLVELVADAAGNPEQHS